MREMMTGFVVCVVVTEYVYYLVFMWYLRNVIFICVNIKENFLFC